MEEVHVERMVDSGVERITKGWDPQNVSGNKALVKVVLQELTMNAARRAYSSASQFCLSESVKDEKALTLAGVAEVLEKKAESFS